MLQFNPNTVVSILLQNNVEIVARFVKSDKDTITIVEPLKVYLVDDMIQVGVFMFGLQPGNECDIQKSQVISMVKTQQLLAQDYENLTKEKK